jgi:chorismate-pyruvate lyase
MTGGSAHPLADRFAGLAAVERILLTTDGTVTPILENIVGERIVPARLTQSFGPADAPTLALLAAPPTRRFLFRSSDLIGSETGTVYVRATTVAVPDLLPAEILHGLRHGAEPIGRLLRRCRVETFREIVECRTDGPDGGAESYRRYRIYIGGTPALLIGETFLWDRLRAVPADPLSTES